MKIFRGIKILAVSGISILVLVSGSWIGNLIQNYQILKKVVERLSAESRTAEILVTKSEFDEKTKKINTTIKFLEYDVSGNALEPKYFTFRGNIIQFQSLVIRFKDNHIKAGDRLRGKSIYLFMKAFVLDDKDTQVFNISRTEGIPSGYKIPGDPEKFETQLWKEFWSYALDPKARDRSGIKSAQIEAPGTMFLPGTIYTLFIEHDGGLRIDTKPVPEIVKGERL